MLKNDIYLEKVLQESKFLKYIWPFFNVVHERFDQFRSSVPISMPFQCFPIFWYMALKGGFIRLNFMQRVDFLNLFFVNNYYLNRSRKFIRKLPLSKEGIEVF